MQADNLRPMDIEKFKEAFKEIKEENPKAIMTEFARDQFRKKDCLFKDKCKL